MTLTSGKKKIHHHHQVYCGLATPVLGQNVANVSSGFCSHINLFYTLHVTV